jgi:hypothetical protein
MWAVLVGVTPIITVLCRELVSLRRDAVRRASIVRIVRDCTGGIRIVDRTPQGDVLEIEVLPCNEELSRQHLRSPGS